MCLCCFPIIDMSRCLCYQWPSSNFLPIGDVLIVYTYLKARNFFNHFSSKGCKKYILEGILSTWKITLLFGTVVPAQVTSIALENYNWKKWVEIYFFSIFPSLLCAFESTLYVAIFTFLLYIQFLPFWKDIYNHQQKEQKNTYMCFFIQNVIFKGFSVRNWNHFR